MHLIFSHGEKGGVGKSLTAAAVIDLFLMRGLKVAVVDGDIDNADIAQRYENAVERSAKIRLSDASEFKRSVNALSTFIESLDENSADFLVVNLPAGARATVDRDTDTIYEMLDILGIARDDVTVLISSGNTDLSVKSTVQIAKDGLGRLAGQVAILVPEFLRDETLADRLRAQIAVAYADVKTSPEPRIFSMPALPADVVEKIRDYPTALLTHLAFQHPQSPIGAGVVTRVRVRQWLRDINSQIVEMLFSNVVKLSREEL